MTHMAKEPLRPFYSEPVWNPPTAMTKKSRPISTAVCAALATALTVAGCSWPAGTGAAATGRVGATATARARSSNYPSSTSTVEHWGSFFGEKAGNFDLRTAPVTVALPGKVAEVASSNSTEYALLTNGALYAWGLGTQGELGDGQRVNSFVVPVRVRFPAGVKIASIPTDVMPYDSALAVD